ncbi:MULTISPECIES: hypothetical protein [Rhodococcus]|uniref:hypothetical protein n=1 Tax=Rhodococcus TaxID=1827 RepID=UPI0007AE44E6|nr:MULTISPECIES: hypothetical protein [Rhodococcus]KZL30476.1 hypothetical protein A3852_23090 [Rhodococcus qingshengii]MCE4165059.1 hypothetical protein [Rhodococcus sp. Ni2]
MQITIEITDSYTNGDEFIRTEEVAVGQPLDGACLKEWAYDTLSVFPGRNGYFVDSLHTIKVLDCVDRSDLVGETFSFD